MQDPTPEPDQSPAATVYQQFGFCDKVLTGLRNASARGRPHDWAKTFVLGLICREDDGGLSSIVRALDLEPQAYDGLEKAFRSCAWSAGLVAEQWEKIVASDAPILKVAGRAVLCADGVLQSKEGVKMPGVKRLHQHSSTSSKGDTIWGHMHGAVGVVCGEGANRHCVPLEVSIQDGMRAAAGWDGASDVGICDETHPVQATRASFNAARNLGVPCILTMDRYFMCEPVISLLRKPDEEAGSCLVHLVTKARKGCVGWYDPPEREPGTKGRPRKKGDKVDIFKLFESAAFELVEAEVNGERRLYDVFVVDLLWRLGRYFPLRFVLCVDSEGRREVLVTTDRTLTASQVITLYRHRWSCECSYRVMKQCLNAFGYRMWSKSMPELDRFAKRGDPDRLESVEDGRDREPVLGAYEAISRYVALSCVATGILQILACREDEEGEITWSSYSRTPKSGGVSVEAVRRFMRKWVSSWVSNDTSSATAAFIRERQVGEGGYRPDLQRKGRR